MKKVIITEFQFKNLGMKLKEPDEKYSNECEVNMNFNGLNFKGKEIDDIIAPNITVTFDINEEHKKQGIITARPFNFKGPSELELNVYYVESDSVKNEIVPVELNWDNVDEEKTDLGHIGIDNVVEMSLQSDNNGGFDISNITIYYNSI